ncbi:hypothetical protein LTR17_017702 [Elasticomyces elasticus]|nr:hypothetical protein LTR17_017702 [Elasticomyces elasticus]
MAPTLVGIPPEVLEMVAKCLNPEDDDSYALLKLRSVCRATRSAVQKLFERTYFTKRSVFFMKSKLRELQDIASSQELANRIEELHVVCRPCTWKRPDCAAKQLSRQPDLDALALTLSGLLSRFPQLSSIRFKDNNYRPEYQKDCPPYYRWDNDATYQATLSALDTSGVQPSTICFEQDLAFVRNQSWLSLRPHMYMLRRLDVALYLDARQGINVDEIGPDFLLALQPCAVLEEVTLYLGFGIEAYNAFQSFASTVVLPRLQHFTFRWTDCNIRSAMLFLDNYAATLKSCNFECVLFTGRDTDHITDLLAMIRATLRLENLSFDACSDKRSLLRFPDMINVDSDSESNEDGYIVVELNETILLKGFDRVQSGIACMLACLTQD